MWKIEHTQFVDSSHDTLHGGVIFGCSENIIERLCVDDTTHDALCSNQVYVSLL